MNMTAPIETDEQRDARLAATQARQEAAGIVVEAKVVAPDTQNYWGNVTRHKHYLPDGVQYIEFEPMTEGARSKYQTATQTEMTMNQNTKSSTMKFNVARDRRALIDNSVKGWFMFGPQGQELGPNQFERGQYTFDKWLQQADPKIVEDLEKAIRKSNAWLQSDLDADEIQEEIARLEQQLGEVRDRELGEDGSSSK